MSIFDRDRPIEVPHRLEDVKDPCTELFYPDWSSRGMRAVRCTRPAKGALQEPGSTGERRLCGIHLNRYSRIGWRVTRDG